MTSLLSERQDSLHSDGVGVFRLDDDEADQSESDSDAGSLNEEEKDEPLNFAQRRDLIAKVELRSPRSVMHKITKPDSSSTLVSESGVFVRKDSKLQLFEAMLPDGESDIPRPWKNETDSRDVMPILRSAGIVGDQPLKELAKSGDQICCVIL